VRKIEDARGLVREHQTDSGKAIHAAGHEAGDEEGQHGSAQLDGGRRGDPHALRGYYC
jgi:hypothetical protein